jgi:predicted secreted protein
MAKLRGKDMVVSKDGIPIAHKRDASFEINAEIMDTTDGDSGGFREKAFADIMELSTEVSGLLSEASASSILSIAGTEVALKFALNNTEGVEQASVSCSALCGNLSIEGSYDGVVSFSASFESNGEIS